MVTTNTIPYAPCVLSPHAVADIEDLCVPPRKATHTESGAADGQGASSVPAPVTMWRGAMFTAFSVELAKWGDQVDPHGPMMACPVAHPGIVAAFLPWSSPAQHKRAMSLLDRTSLILVYHRDRGEGRVGIDAAGRPRVWYWPCQEDCVSVARGVGLGIKALAAAGATEIGTLSQSHGTCLVPDGADGPGVVAEYVR